MNNLENINNEDIFGKFKDFEFKNLANVKGGAETKTTERKTKETSTDKDSSSETTDC